MPMFAQGKIAKFPGPKSWRSWRSWRSYPLFKVQVSPRGSAAADLAVPRRL